MEEEADLWSSKFALNNKQIWLEKRQAGLGFEKFLKLEPFKNPEKQIKIQNKNICYGYEYYLKNQHYIVWVKSVCLLIFALVISRHVTRPAPYCRAPQQWLLIIEMFMSTRIKNKEFC